MRTALRASLATAVLTGALLAPAAGAAHAATTVRQAAAVTSQSGADRFSGTPVHIGEGLVAVLRHEAEGPEAWIRAVGPDWKPGDNYMFRVLTVLDRANPGDTVNGLDLEITKVNSAAPVLTVAKAGATRSFPLPLSEAGRTHGARCVSATQRLGLHGTLVADLTTTPEGPQVQLVDGITKEPYKKLTRTGPALAKGDLTVARIVNPGAALPSFEYETPGGEHPFGTARFPELPAGCAFTYSFEDEAPAPEPEGTPSAGASTAPSNAPAAKPSPATAAAGPKAQTAGRTAVVREGGVAAGAEDTGLTEVDGAAAADADDSTTAYAGAGLAAIVAGLGASFLTRRRAARPRR
ncbi:hypothetical protein [Streptomyces erythrochromogenes]|uniref:hypothetical protein n=1 Tax=Streptomyces erythrochromogenes TaxID=285574 RepID=UPI00224C9220|nr:hypothetical protein [Streptomyces erythrochromogenes]MCX5584886.1 hypothetical protein [Streptomyces erythrochromogenes]